MDGNNPPVDASLTTIRLVAFFALAYAISWSFLTLCERSGTAYPVGDFATQANAMLNALPNAKEAWSGTTLPARSTSARSVSSYRAATSYPSMTPAADRSTS